MVPGPFHYLVAVLCVLSWVNTGTSWDEFTTNCHLWKSYKSWDASWISFQTMHLLYGQCFSRKIRKFLCSSDLSPGDWETSGMCDCWKSERFILDITKLQPIIVQDSFTVVVKVKVEVKWFRTLKTNLCFWKLFWVRFKDLVLKIKCVADRRAGHSSLVCKLT
jgi:hypothetical protein